MGISDLIISFLPHSQTCWCVWSPDGYSWRLLSKAPSWRLGLLD